MSSCAWPIPWPDDYREACRRSSCNDVLITHFRLLRQQRRTQRIATLESLYTATRRLRRTNGQSETDVRPAARGYQAPCALN